MAIGHDPASWKGQDVIDREGSKIGTLDEVYVDAHTGVVEWGAVRTGMLGMGNPNFVPLTAATIEDDGIRVPYEKSHVKDAPEATGDGLASPEDEAELFRHYELAYEPGAAAAAAPEHRDPSGGDAMTRSEEELHVGTASHERERVRLRKHVVTDEVETTVPVRREEARIEREPITDENADEALSGPEISEGEHEVVLHEEEPVVEKRAVPKERVRLESEGVTEEREVREPVRREEIEVERGKDRR